MSKMEDDPRVCAVSHCQRAVTTRGYCGAHYQQVYREKNPENLILKDSQMACVADKCAAIVASNRLCHNHLRQVKRGLIDPIPGSNAVPNPSCIKEGCSALAHSRKGGLCHTHAPYAKKPVENPKNLPKTGPCLAGDCDAPRYLRGYCGWHSRQHAAGEAFTVMPDSGYRICAFALCDSRSYSREFCGMHRNQMAEHGRMWRRDDPWRGMPPASHLPGPCAVTWCERPSTPQTVLCRRHRARARAHKLGHDQAAVMFSQGECDACGQSEELVVDHDHACCAKSPTCGECVRGMLCNSCNTALGFLYDDADLMRRLATYITAVAA